MINILEKKLREFDIPTSVIENFVSKYRMADKGLYPEIKIDKAPSDDCFETLKFFCDMSSEMPDELLVHSLLNISYVNVLETKKKIANLFSIDTSSVDSWFRADVIFIKSQDVDVLSKYFDGKFEKREYIDFFKEALVLGSDEAISRTNAVFALLGELAFETICGTNGTIFYQYSDPAGLINYLMGQGLGAKKTAEMLKSDPLLIMFFRQKGSRSFKYGHNQAYIDDAIRKVMG